MLRVLLLVYDKTEIVICAVDRRAYPAIAIEISCFLTSSAVWWKAVLTGCRQVLISGKQRRTAGL